jgi:hypothetical protein
VAHVYNTRHLLERFPDPPTPHRVMCVMCGGCVRNRKPRNCAALCFVVRVFGDSLCPHAHPLTRIRDRNRSSSSNNTHCVCVHVCACCCCWLGGPKRGPFLVTSGRTWDMKKNSWAPKLFYDNMPAHGGSTPQSAVWHDDGLIHVRPSGSKRNAPCSV